MAVIKAISSRASIKKAINYITKEEKTEEKLISGQNCTPKTAYEEMRATKELWHKTEGRQYKHFVQSFSKDEKLTPEQAHQIACELVKDNFKGHEVLIATHKDKDHIHSHILVNSVNYENGRKLNWSKRDLANMKDRSDQLCKENNLSICHKNNEIATYDIDKYKAMEKGIRGTYKSYVVDTALAVNNAKEKAISREDFIHQMKEQGYETNWSDKKKYITFQDKEGNKVRNSNLTKTFKEDYGKERLENEFIRNQERTEDRATREENDDRRTTIEYDTRIKEDRLSKQPSNDVIREIQQQIREVQERTDRATGADKQNDKGIGELKPELDTELQKRDIARDWGFER